MILMHIVKVGAVVIGLDTQVNYKKYAKAFAYLTRNPGCHFIVTNEDTTFPQHGSFYPGKNIIMIEETLKRILIVH